MTYFLYLFLVPRKGGQDNPADHLHDQHGGGFSPPTAQSDKNQIGLHQRQCPAQTAVPGHRKHHGKVDRPAAKLVTDLLATGHLLPRSNTTIPEKLSTTDRTEIGCRSHFWA